MSEEIIEQVPSEDLVDDKTCKWFDLKLNRDLLDFNFDGYKLSLDTLAKYSLDLEQQTFDTVDISHQNELKTAKPLLYQHIKLFGFHNHLFNNEFLNLDFNFKSDDFKSLYYFDKNWFLVKIEFNNTKRFLRKTSLQLQKNDTIFYNERVNITMKFLRNDLAIICDGCEMLYLCEVINDKEVNSVERWNVLFKYNLEQHGCNNSVIKDAVLNETKNNASYQLNLILMNIHEDALNHNYETLISYLRFENEADELNKWLFKSCKKLNCFHTVPDYVSLTRGGDADEEIVVIGSSLVKFMDENGQVIQENFNLKASTNGKEQQKYEWNELGHDVNVYVNLNEKNAIKAELKVTITERTLEIVYKGQVFLKENFYAPVDKTETNWQIEPKEGIIEISLKKKETLMWSTLFKSGDVFGKYRDVSKKSAELSETASSETNGSDKVAKKIFNLNQDLEECDGILNDEQQIATNDALIEAEINKDQVRMVTEDDLQMIMYLNFKEKKCCTKSYVSNNKFLFQMQVNTKKSPAVCLRHDVDGILWQPENLKLSSTDAHFTHLHTFLAFGYVQASKQNSKFQLAAPNCSFVCICDTIKHLYIYKVRSEVGEETQLRNRKTGKAVTHVSKQFVVSLEADQEIMGVYCSNEYLVVLMENSLHFIQVNI